jgi:hypothetical protein
MTAMDINLIPKDQRPIVKLGRATGVPVGTDPSARYIVWLSPSTVTIARYEHFEEALADCEAVAAILGLEFQLEQDIAVPVDYTPGGAAVADRLRATALGLKGCTGSVSVTASEVYVAADGTRTELGEVTV